MSKADFSKLYTEALSESSRIVPIYAQLLAVGLNLNVVYKRKTLPKFVGTHRANRDGTIINGREAMAIWDEIDRTGVAPELYADATAFEEPLDRANEIKFLDRCRADPHLRDYVPGDIQMSSVACSHWNQALAAADAGLAGRATVP